MEPYLAVLMALFYWLCAQGTLQKSLGGNTVSARDLIRIGHIQDKCFNLCTISSTWKFHILKNIQVFLGLRMEWVGWLALQVYQGSIPSTLYDSPKLTKSES